MDARRLNVVLAGVAGVAIAAAVGLALRGPPSVPASAAPPATRPAPAPLDPPDTPRAPGEMNAIAAKALASGGPRTPRVSVGPPGLGRTVVRYALSYDATGPDTAVACVREAGEAAIAALGASGEPAPVACASAGPDRLDGHVRLATRPGGPGAAAGAVRCDATVAYTLTRAGAPAPGQSVGGGPETGPPDAACAAALRSAEAALRAKLGAG